MFIQTAARLSRSYYAARGHVCNLCICYKNYTIIYVYQLLFFLVRPSNQPIVTRVAFCHKRVGCPCYARWHTYTRFCAYVRRSKAYRSSHARNKRKLCFRLDCFKERIVLIFQGISYLTSSSTHITDTTFFFFLFWKQRYNLSVVNQLLGYGGNL